MSPRGLSPQLRTRSATAALMPPTTLTLLLPSLAGNCFYVSMPAGPPDPAPPPGPPQAIQAEEPPRPSTAECPPDPPGPLHDVDLIFRTIEQLTLKLNRLKVSPSRG